MYAGIALVLCQCPRVCTPLSEESYTTPHQKMSEISECTLEDCTAQGFEIFLTRYGNNKLNCSSGDLGPCLHIYSLE